MDSLTEDQAALLKHFQEITDIQDEHIALATLASLDWDLTKAVEASISSHSPDVVIDNTEQSENNRIVGSSREESPVSGMLLDDHDSSPIIIDDADEDDVETFRTDIGRSSNRSTRSSTFNGAGPSSSSSDLREHMWQGSPSSQNLFHRTTRNMNRVRYPRHIMTFTDVNSDTDEDKTFDSDMQFDVEDLKKTANRPPPLVPVEFSSVTDALINFQAVFESRYGDRHPQFFIGNLADALSEAFEPTNGNIFERRPLALYIHTDRSIASNIFAKHVLCSDSVTALLNAQFVLWPWDITHRQNRQLLLEFMSSPNMRDARDALDFRKFSEIVRVPTNRFPLILVLAKAKGMVQSIGYAWGVDSHDEFINSLMEILQENQQIKQTERDEERERLEREEIRQEQAREYERSLAQDRARQEQLEQERKRQREEEQRRIQAEEDKVRRANELAASLPSEPDASEESVTIRFRYPNGQTEDRRFRNSEPLQYLITFIEARGFCPQSFRIWNSDLPRKNVVETFNLQKTFADLNWPVREQVTVEEI
ncbi:unnamed protein product [Dracunculus medinensis]|uniref:UBX domain-containing protein n=1 Tax=Dracunculus medinensis TaxID=318479 RepID=A0A158Q492_DRAME|nr:unnamed protein product [Dracunculus medinensis]